MEQALGAAEGGADPGETVEVFLNGESVGEAVANSEGLWSLQLDETLEPGTWEVTAEVRNDNGIGTASSDFEVLAPDSVTILSPADGATVRTTTPTLSGVATPGAEVEIWFNGELAGTTTANEDGTWEFIAPEPLAEGEVEATARVTGEAGEVEDTIVFEIELSDGVAIASPADGTTTNDPSPTIRGTAEPGSTVVVACLPIPECVADVDCEVPPATCADDTLQTWSCRCIDGDCACDATATPCGDNICGEEGGVAACVEPPPVQVNVETRQIVITENVFFATGSDVIEERSFSILNHVARVLEDNPQITRVRVEGHTDNVGRARNNLQLSQRRAASVVRYLTARGIDASRLESEGYGQDRPIASNDTDEGRAQNRRVEFHIVDPD